MNSDIYRAIQREYDFKRQKILNEAFEKKENLYKKIPKYKELEDKKNEIAIDFAKSIMSSDSLKREIAEENLELKLKEIDDSIYKLLNQNGYDIKDLEPNYECKICQDTGLITTEQGVVQCSCFTQKIVNVTYKQNNN